MLGAGGAHSAGSVGGGRGQRRAGCGDERARDLGAGHAQRQRIEPCAGQQADAVIAADGGDQRQRPRPEAFGERQREAVEPRLARRGLGVGEMGDQRVEGRPPLDGVDLGDSCVRGREPRQAVNRLRRHADEPAGAQNRRCLSDGRRVRLRDAG